MVSNLRIQTTYHSVAIQTTSTSEQHPAKKQKMSLSQTYRVASFARSKLGKEAGKGDHNLRVLVGHANLLDSLMLELRDAERQQEAWFHSTVKKAQKEEKPQHIQWADRIEESDEEVFEDDSSDSDSDSDFDDEDFELVAASLPKSLKAAPVAFSSQDYDDDMYEDEEAAPELALTRTQSHPPELIDDSDSESDESSPPNTPPQSTFDLSAIQTKSGKSTTPFVQGDFLIQSQGVSLVEAY
jgi:hypothetical protein